MSEDRTERNKIFGVEKELPAGVDPNTPVVTAVDAVRAEFGLELPVDTVPLPSRGLVYSTQSSFYGRETVDIRGMTAREEDILTNKALLKNGTVITELIQSCIVDKSLRASDLLVGDRNALMVAIRITGYGQEYKGEIECSDCGVSSDRTFDLAQLPLKTLEIEPINPGENRFQFVLPYTKKTVEFGFLTSNDELDISSANDKKKKMGMSETSNVTTSLLYLIKTIDGVSDRAKISQFVRMMPARDSLALRSFIKKNEPGIEMKQESACLACGHREEVDMPLGPSFLWPTSE